MARLLTMGNASPLASASYALTTLGVSDVGDGGPTPDSKYFAYGTDRFSFNIGSTLDSTTLSGYTITQLKEYIVYNTADGSYGTVLTRFVEFALRSGPAALTADAITSVECSGGQSLVASSASYSSNPNGGTWTWVVTTNAANETTPDYLPSGTVTVTV